MNVGHKSALPEQIAKRIYINVSRSERTPARLLKGTGLKEMWSSVLDHMHQWVCGKTRRWRKHLLKKRAFSMKPNCVPFQNLKRKGKNIEGKKTQKHPRGDRNITRRSF